MLELGRRSDKSDIAKRREKAEKYLQKGKIPAALEEYLAILREDPENDTIRQTAADLYIQVNDTQQAAKLLGDLFYRQADGGDSTNAALTYKKLTRFAKPTLEQTFRYAQFIEATNKKEALESYEAALAGFTAQHNSKRALAVLERIVFLDPSGQNFWRAGELALEIGEGKKAAVCFLSVGELEQKSGGNSAPWYERAYRADQSNVDGALCYGRVLVEQNNFLEALQVLQPLVKNREKASPEVRDLYGRALMGAGRLTEAEPFLWGLFEQNPERTQQIVDLVAAFIDAQQDAAAVALARKLERFLRSKGNRREFVGMVAQLLEQHRPSVEMLEYMAELFNGSNRESDYCQTLIKLFDLYYAAGNFAKAADALDRAAEVDAYEPGHQSRLDMLRGKIPEPRVNAIAGRFTIVSKATETQQQEEEADEHSMLQDLMLQAEILVQYGMRTKAQERLVRIQQLFPHEEDRNEELRRLYMNVGLMPKYAGEEAAPAAAAAAAGAGVAAAGMSSIAPIPAVEPAEAMAERRASAAAKEPDIEVNSLQWVTETARKLYQQANVKGVVGAALTEIGMRWGAVRCVGGLRSPGKPPSLVLEYAGTGIQPSELPVRVKLLSELQDFAIAHGPAIVAEPAREAELSNIIEELNSLGPGALMLLPLSDGADQVGLLILQSPEGADWRPSDLMLLRTLSDQVVLALHNARLRRLVRNLSVTDEKSGLLKRASYTDVLMSEVARSSQQGTPTTVMLMEFGKGSAMLKEFGQNAVEALMRDVSQSISTHIRQADVAVLYDLTTIALILADTPERGALLALEKLRRILADVRLPGRETPPPSTVGVAEAVMRPAYDAADIVTEVINRVESALEKARTASNKVCALQSEFENAAA
jgi:tetratricopeptide (TPR) repeat protein/GGDEF domain-containing protein